MHDNLIIIFAPKQETGDLLELSSMHQDAIIPKNYYLSSALSYILPCKAKRQYLLILQVSR